MSDEPERGLQRRPAPAVRVEQAEHRPPRVWVVPGCRACCAIVLHPTRDRSAAGVDLLPSGCPSCSGAPCTRRGTCRPSGRAPRRRLRRRPGRRRVALERPGAGRVLDHDVVRDRGVLVVEVEGERPSRPWPSSVGGSKPMPVAACHAGGGRRRGGDRRVRVDRRRPAAGRAGRRAGRGVEVAVRDTASRPAPACSSGRASR